jgi:hypothetical protein
MASFLLANAIQPEPMGDWVLEQTKLISNIVNSPVCIEDPELDTWLQSEGGSLYQRPYWDSLDRTVAPLTINQTLPVVFGGTAPTPNAIPTHLEQMVRLERANVWSATALSRYFNKNQADPIQAIVNDLAGYWAYRDQVAFLAAWIGVFADNTANDSGDLTLDVSDGGVFEDGVTNFTAENAIETLGLMGDAEDDLGIIVTHSKVRRTMEKADLLDAVKDSTPGTPRSYRGRQLIINDSMTKGSGNVYHTYFFGAGSTFVSMVNPPRPFVISMYEDGGNGAGQEAVWSRVRRCVHPRGFKFIGSFTANTGGPTDATTSGNLGHAGSWDRSVSEVKQVRARRLITTEG